MVITHLIHYTKRLQQAVSGVNASMRTAQVKNTHTKPIKII